MATGLIALLDDVAAIAKLAATSIDDVAAQTAKASVKAAGVVIDDTAVTPTYVVGLSPPSRELPIIGRIALGSLRNKILFLLPICIALGFFANWLISPLLMVGGIYLCFEGAEKLYEAFFDHGHGHPEQEASPDSKILEDQKVAGAIRTDFILSAEIMALTLAGVAASNIYTQAAVLAAVGVLITAAVYGVVALIVKADDFGLYLAERGNGSIRVLGRALVKAVPAILSVLSVVGTAAMLWVGGSIIIHGLAEFGFHAIEHAIEAAADGTAIMMPPFESVARWITATLIQAAVGVVIGAAAILLYRTARSVTIR